jgi:hypothetical protein
MAQDPSFPYSSAELKRVSAIRFSVLSPEEIARHVPLWENSLFFLHLRAFYLQLIMDKQVWETFHAMILLLP